MKITRRIEFDAGHRVLGHEGKCASFHGHRYAAEITVDRERLDKLGRTIDFGVIKEVVGEWIDVNWDHSMILNEKDPLAKVLNGGQFEQFKKPFLMAANPTAENMAEYLFRIAKKLLEDYGVRVTAIRLYETPNCWADYAPSD